MIEIFFWLLFLPVSKRGGRGGVYSARAQEPEGRVLLMINSNPADRQSGGRRASLPFSWGPRRMVFLCSCGRSATSRLFQTRVPQVLGRLLIETYTSQEGLGTMRILLCPPSHQLEASF